MNKLIYIATIFVVFASQSWAQELTYKEIKTIEKTIKCNSKSSLSIKGERTFLTLKTWDKDYIQAKIDVISKFTSKDQANTDLEKINVVFEKKGKKIIYSNALRIKSPADKPKSNLSVRVSLTIPVNMDVDITNAFGELDISGIYGEVTSSSDFTMLDIHDFEGTSTFNSKYGDLDIDSYKGALSLNADRSNLIMNDVSGNADVEAKYGEIEIYYPQAPSKYKVKLSFSPMSLYIPDGFHEKISLSCKDCEIVSKNSNMPISMETKGSTQNAEIASDKAGKSSSLMVSELENITVKYYQPTSKSN